MRKICFVYMLLMLCCISGMNANPDYIRIVQKYEGQFSRIRLLSGDMLSFHIFLGVGLENTRPAFSPFQERDYSASITCVSTDGKEYPITEISSSGYFELPQDVIPARFVLSADGYATRTLETDFSGNRFFYFIGNRKIEFLTVHKSKGLEADYVIILQCNKDTYGFPSMVSDDPVLNYVLTESDQYPYGEERRLFYVAITRAKIKTYILYDRRFPSVFVDEFLHPEKITEESYVKHPNANKKWTRSADNFLLTLYHEGKSIKYIANKMGRSQTSIAMRLGKLEENL